MANDRHPAAAQAEQAFIVLSSGHLRDTEATLAAIEAAGGHAAHVIPPRGVIARVPAHAEARIRAHTNVAGFHRGPAPAFDAVGQRDLAAAAGAWNHLLAVAAQSTEPPGTPLVADAFVPNPPAGSRFAPLAAAPGYYQTSEFLIGKVAVGVILPESIGDGENWTASRQTTVFNEIVSGLNWWVTMGGSAARLTFYYDQRFSVPTQYEPITRTGWSDENIWVTDIFQNMGFTSGDNFGCAYSYLNSLRSSLHTDWAYAIIVADSLNDPDGRFGDGTYFAWAYLGGPYVIMTYDNDGWGINRMDLVTSHETGHIFLAADEYCSSGYACCNFGTYGYLGIPNGNCVYENPSSVPCIMRNNESTLCTYTRGQVGWRDSDADGLPDPTDNTVAVTLNAPPAPIAPGPVSFSGTATDVPFDSSTRLDVTINTVVSVKYRIDGGPWIDAAATDGAFDEDSEGYGFTATLPNAGTYQVETQAFSSSGNVSTIAQRSVAVSMPALLVTDVDSLTVPEAGTAVFQVKLGQAPSSPVTVTVSRASGDSDITIQSGASLRFKPADWNVYQPVTLAAAHDADRVNGQAVFVCSAPGHASRQVTATELDDEVPADFDMDGDVDLTDFAFFNLCFSGPNAPAYTPECAATDLDRDGDVDLADFTAVQACFNGPNRPPTCR